MNKALESFVRKEIAALEGQEAAQGQKVMQLERMLEMEKMNLQRIQGALGHQNGLLKAEDPKKKKEA